MTPFYSFTDSTQSLLIYPKNKQIKPKDTSHPKKTSSFTFLFKRLSLKRKKLKLNNKEEKKFM